MIRVRSQELLDAQRHRPWHHCGELVNWGVADRVDAPELTEQRSAPHRAEPWHDVEFRSKGGTTTACAVVGDGEAVRFIPHALHKKKGRTVAFDDDRPSPAGAVQLLISLGEAEYWNARESRLAKCLDGSAQLAFAAVDQD
jgi:hypothetical protein